MSQRCSECGKPLLQRNERDGQGWVIRTPVLKISDDGQVIMGKCRGCGTEVRLPLVLRSQVPLMVPVKKTTPST